jgi:hypothetical protein
MDTSNHPLTSISHMGTSNYTSSSPTTSNFTHGHLQSPLTFHTTPKFHTWAHPITHPDSPPLPISHIDTYDHPPTFPITSNFTPGHLPLPTQIRHHPPIHTWAHPMTHPISPPLPISLLGTSNYPYTFTSTCHFTPGII